MDLWCAMIQIALSFVAGIYVGTEYEMRPYLDQIREAASRLEKKPPTPEEETPTPKPAKGWFSWGSSEETTKEKEK